MIAKLLGKLARESGAEMRDSSGQKAFTGRQYLVGLAVIFMTSYSQYLIPGVGPITSALMVYGVSIVAVSVLSRTLIVRRAFINSALALKLGLALFGLFSLFGGMLATAATYLILAFDPSAANLLNRPLPILHISHNFAWIMVGASIFVIGPAEEYIFRGFVYGFLLNLFKGRHWFSLALISSLLFASVHLYYALVYGIASIIPFIDVAAIGMAMAITYYLSGGNLFIPALIHGAFDASGFIGVAVSPHVGLALRALLTLTGLVIAAKIIWTPWRNVGG